MESTDNTKSWMIASCCCFIVLLFYGLMRVSGLLFVEIMAEYKVDRNQASLPFILAFISRSISGPIGGFLAQRFELKNIITLGCIIGVFGVGLCSISSSIVQINVFWGVLYGFGFGLTVPLLPQIINLYFKKHKAKAMGLTFAGSCIGGFILAPIVDFIIERYGISGTFLILFGIMLNGIPFAWLLKTPVLVTNHRNILNNKSPKLPDQNLSKINLDVSSSIIDTENPNQNSTETHTCKLLIENTSDSTDISAYNPIIGGVNTINNDCKTTNNEACVSKIDENHTSSDNFNRKLNKFDRFKKITFIKVDKIRLSKHSRVFCDPTFLIISTSWSVMSTFSQIVLTVFSDFFMDKGLSATDTAHLLMCYSFSDLVGRLLIGYVADKKYITKAKLSALGFIFLAGVMVVVTLVKTFGMSVFPLILTGLFVGALIPTIPMLIFEYIEEDKHAFASASLSITTWPVSLVGPHLIGYFRDQLKSYNGMIYLFCGIYAATAVMLLFLRNSGNDSRNKRVDTGGDIKEDCA